MKTKVYFAQIASFDTHVNQNATDRSTGQGYLLGQLADAIAAFQADIEAFGMQDRVIGMTYSEFGRRVQQNDSMGTDHGTCAPQFLFGSGINGEVYSSNPDLTDLDSNADLKWKIDFRQLYSAVLGDWFGLSEPMRKALLLDSTSADRFAPTLPVNNSATIQSLIRTPLRSVASPKTSSKFIFDQIHPNPFHTSTTIQFALTERMPVSLEVFNTRGEQIALIVNESLGRGQHLYSFSAAALPSGTYLCRLSVGGEIEVRQMSVLK
jgi:hypothetical protein